MIQVCVQDSWQKNAWQSLVASLEQKLGVTNGSMTAEHVGAMWQFCQQEAALLDTTDKVCSLFSHEASFYPDRRKLAQTKGFPITGGQLPAYVFLAASSINTCTLVVCEETLAQEEQVALV